MPFASLVGEASPGVFGEASLARDEAWAARMGELSRVVGAFVSGVAPVSVT